MFIFTSIQHFLNVYQIPDTALVLVISEKQKEKKKAEVPSLLIPDETTIRKINKIIMLDSDKWSEKAEARG